jgi:hypothetical protein
VVVRFDTRWFDSNGYRPTRFRFDLAPAPRARTISIAVHASGDLSGSSSVVARESLRVRKGATSVETMLLAPQQGDRPFQWFTVEIDGVAHPELSSVAMPSHSGMQMGGRRYDLRLLSPAGESRVAAGVGQGTPGVPPRDRRGVARELTALSGLLIDEGRSELLDEWLAYSSADVIVLDGADLVVLQKQRPASFAALRQWVLGGGNLWVTRVGPKTESLGDLADLLDADRWLFDLQTQPEQQEDDESDLPGPQPPAAGTGRADAASNGETTDEESELAPRGRVKSIPVEGAAGWWHESLVGRSASEAVAWEALDNESNADKLNRLASLLGDKATSRGWYVSRPMGFGRVLAFPRTALDAPRSLNRVNLDVAGQRWRASGWSSRHGFEPGVGSPDFGKMLIPGVGVAPVMEFQVLITLFVLAIGPLNYWVLARAQRLHLLVLTTPLAAALVTTGLFAYAIVGDGFGTRVRARSLTLLNQAEGLAATWSHLSHYAGSAPTEGMAFPRDTAVYPIDPFWEVSLAAPTAPERGLTWVDGGQRLTPGWLVSRTAAQHLVVRCGSTPIALEVSKSEGELAARNLLGAEVELLLVTPAEGDWQRAEGIGDGDSATLKPVTTSAAANELRLLFVENRPEFPVGAGKAIEETLERFGAGSVAQRRQLRTREASAGDLDANLLSAGIDRIAGLDGGPALDLPPRSFVAIARKSMHTPLGGEGFQEVGSFHVVVGRW